MKMNDFIQRIKENIKVLYILSLIFVGFAFYWVFLYSWQSDKDTAFDYFEDLWEKDPSEELIVLRELSYYNQSRRKLSILKDLKIDTIGELPLEIFPSVFMNIYCINKNIYVVGANFVVDAGFILRIQKDGKWVEETLEIEENVWLPDIWGNEKGIFAVGTTHRRGEGEGIILRRQEDGNWKGEKIESNDVRKLYDIWGNEEGIFAVGITDGMEGIILRRQEDGNWKGEKIESKDVGRLSGIWGNEEGIFAVGGTNILGKREGVILRRQGDRNWKREKIESKDVGSLSDIWGNNEKGIFAVGLTSIIVGEEEVVILRRQRNGTWVEETIETKKVDLLSGIWGNNEKGIFAVGQIKLRTIDGEKINRGVIFKRNKDKNWLIDSSAKIHWEKLNFEAEVQTNYGTLSFFLVTFITLSVFGYTLLPVKKAEKIQLKDKKQESIIQQLKADITGYDILWETIRETKEKMESMRKQSFGILVFGIVMALLGGFLFYYILELSFDKFGSMKDPPDHWLIFTGIRATGILLLVESITYFFLRQYRAFLNDYKYFFNIYTKRSDYAAVIKLLSNEKLSDADMKTLIDKLLTEKVEQSSTSSPDLDGPTLQKIGLEVLELIKKMGK